MVVFNPVLGRIVSVLRLSGKLSILCFIILQSFVQHKGPVRSYGTVFRG